MNHTRRHHLKLAFACMLAPDNGGGTGGGGKTIEEQLTQARADLATAQSSLSTLTTAAAERDNAVALAQSLQTQFDALTQTATAAQSELVTARAQITSLTSERDTARTESASKDQRIGNLESLCRIKGLNSNGAPPALEEPKDAMTVEQWQAKYDAAKSSSERSEIARQMQAAADAKKAKAK